MAGQGYNNRGANDIRKRGLGFSGGGQRDTLEYRGGARMRNAAVDEDLKRRWGEAGGDAQTEDTTEQWRQEQRSRGRPERDIDMDEYDTQQSMSDGYKMQPDDYGYENRQYLGPMDEDIHELPDPSGPDDEEQYWDKSKRSTDELFNKWRAKLKAKGLTDEEIEDIISDAVGLHD